MQDTVIGRCSDFWLRLATEKLARERPLLIGYLSALMLAALLYLGAPIALPSIAAVALPNRAKPGSLVMIVQTDHHHRFFGSIIAGPAVVGFQHLSAWQDRCGLNIEAPLAALIAAIVGAHGYGVSVAFDSQGACPVGAARESVSPHARNDDS